MLETHTADSKLAETSQEQFMSADKLSNDTTNTDSTRRPSALMKVANTIDTSVDSSLDAFIAEANSTLDAIGGWGISDDAAGETSTDLADAESRASAAEQRAEDIEKQTQSALTSAQSQLAEAEARVAAAEQRASRAEKQAKNTKASLLASAVPRQQAARPAVAPQPIPEIAPVAPAPAAPVTLASEAITAPVVAQEYDAFPDTISEQKRKPKYALFAGVFLAGGLLAFGAAKLMVGGDNKGADAPAAAPALMAAPDQVEAAPTPAAAAPVVEELPAVKSLAAEPEMEIAPEVVPLDTNTEEADKQAAAAVEAERLAADAAAAQAAAEALAQDAADKAAAAAQLAADNAAAAAKAAAENAAAVKAVAKPAATKTKRSAKKSSKKKASKAKAKAKSKPKAKTKKKAPAKPKGGIVDPFA